MRLPLLFTLILLVPTLLADAYIYFRIPTRLRVKGYEIKTRRCFLVSAILSTLLLVACMCFPKRDAEASLIPVMWMLYTWASIYIPKFLYVILDLIGRIPELFKRKAWPVGLYAGLPLAVICFIAMWWGAIAGRRQIMVTEVDVVSDKVPGRLRRFPHSAVFGRACGHMGQ